MGCLPHRHLEKKTTNRLPHGLFVWWAVFGDVHACDTLLAVTLMSPSRGIAMLN
jgi:hypothetical protein